MTSAQGTELIDWLKLVWVSQLALGVVVVLALVALVVVTLWRSA